MSDNAQQPEPDRNVDNPEPDVLLDVPKVSVDSIRLAVDGLEADLSLRARVANLVQVDAGVRVHLSGGELNVNGVNAEAQLRVRLEQLTRILGRALDTLDNNPHIIEALARTAIDDVNHSTQRLAPGVAGAPAAEVRASARRSNGVAESGQQVGTVGAVADRDRPGPGQPGVDRSGLDRPGRARPDPGREPGPGRGPGRFGPGPVSSEPRAGGPGPLAGGPGPAGQARPEGRHPESRGPEGSTGQSGGRPDQSAAPGPSPSGEGDGGLSAAAQAAAQNAAQFAEQAGETLRQAGRSVWEAIQGGVAQHRPQDRHDR